MKFTQKKISKVDKEFIKNFFIEGSDPDRPLPIKPAETLILESGIPFL